MTMDKPPVTMTREELQEVDKQLSASPSVYTKPIRIYCDVDGVVIPATHSAAELESRYPDAVELDVIPPYPWQYDTFELIRSKMWWDKDVIERLAALSNHPQVDFVWLTDWRVSAPHALDELLGIKSVGYLDWQQKFSDYNQVFKRHAIIEEQLDAPSKFIWIDDRANRPYGIAPHVFADEKDDFEFEYDEEGEIIGDITDGYTDIIPASQYLNVTTKAATGLTLAELDMIEKWIEENLA